jgi:phage FluMu protein Com
MSQLQHVVCTTCEKGILTVVAEVGIEAEGSTEKFQSLSAAHGRIYKCDVCGKLFVKVDNEFLELRY